MRQIDLRHISEVGFITAITVLAFACQPARNINSNVNANANSNNNANSAMSNNNFNSSSDNSGPSINTREPDKYSATLVFSIETEGGDKAIGIPSLNLQVARSGDDRRVEFKLPDGSPLIYLDHDNHHYVILPARKQYAELTKIDAKSWKEELALQDEFFAKLGRHLPAALEARRGTMHERLAA